MPATFTRYPIDIERKDTGMGGKPPVDRRTTGGGGDGDDYRKHRSSSNREPRYLTTRYRRILLCGLAGDSLLFLALVGSFLVREGSGQLNSGTHAAAWHALAIPPIIWINTAVLLLSGVTMELARRPFFSETEIMEEWLGLGRPALRRSMPWLLATLVLGGLFLAGQWLAWAQLAARGIWAGTSANSHFFYLITGMHALQLLLGMAAMVGAVGSMFFIRRVMWRQVAIDCAAWYWYTMSVLWVILFAVLLCAP